MVSNENYHYEIDVNKRVKEIEPISVGFIKTKKHAEHQISNINCLGKKHIKQTSANLNKLISESELKDSISYIRDSMKKLDSSACSYNKKLYISKLKQNQKPILLFKRFLTSVSSNSFQTVIVKNQLFMKDSYKLS